MSTLPQQKPADPIEHLRIERRSYILGTIIVWIVILITLAVIYAKMEPGLFSASRTMTLHQALQREAKLTPQQQLMRQLIDLLGALALFFLNWRFSFIIQRPRWAFVPKHPDARPPAERWLWWAVLAFFSLFLYLLLQPLFTWLMAHLGTLEIRDRQSHPPPSGPF
ncbi:MAG: hypothetical protein ACRD1Y_08045 [Terriglobales bacterium]